MIWPPPLHLPIINDIEWRFPMEEKKEKRKRAPRRNFAAERAELAMYVQVSLDVLKTLDTNEPSFGTSFMAGQIAALKAVQARMGQ